MAKSLKAKVVDLVKPKKEVKEDKKEVKVVDDSIPESKQRWLR